MGYGKFILEDENDINSDKEQSTQQQPLYFDNNKYSSKVLCYFKVDRNLKYMQMFSPFFFSSRKGENLKLVTHLNFSCD